MINIFTEWLVSQHTWRLRSPLVLLHREFDLFSAGIMKTRTSIYCKVDIKWSVKAQGYDRSLYICYEGLNNLSCARATRKWSSTLHEVVGDRKAIITIETKSKWNIQAPVIESNKEYQTALKSASGSMTKIKTFHKIYMLIYVSKTSLLKVK